MYLKKIAQIKLVLLILFFTTTKTNELNTQKKSLTLVQSVGVGGIVGGLEVIFPGQMLAYGMNREILKEPFVLRNSYQGFITHALGQIPLVAIQKTIQVKTSEAISNWQQAELSQLQKIMTSFISGVGGALIGTPSNAVQLYLQDQANFNKTNREAFKNLGLRSMRGFTPNGVIKEGPFAVGYQVLLPKCQEILHPLMGKNAQANALGGAIAGFITAIATQPGAVLRNRMQNDWHEPVGKTMRQTAQEVLATEGIKGFWSGFSKRGTRVAVAVQLYAYYTNLLEDKILNQ